MKNKPLMWTLIILGVSLAGYVTYTLVTKKAAAKKNVLGLSTQDLSNIGTAAGSFFSGLFSKKTDTSQLDYNDLGAGQSLDNIYADSPTG